MKSPHAFLKEMVAVINEFQLQLVRKLEYDHSYKAYPDEKKIPKLRILLCPDKQELRRIYSDPSPGETAGINC